MKDSSASIRESKLPLDEDDKLQMQSGGECGGGAGGGIGVGNISLFNEMGAASGSCFFFLKYGYFSIPFFSYFFSWLLAFFKVHYINIRKIFYLQYA